MLGFNLPDWKSSLNEALSNYVKTPLEQSTANFAKLAETKADNLQKDLNQKFADFKSDNNRFQKTTIAILFATFLIIAISLTFKEYDRPTNHAE